QQGADDVRGVGVPPQPAGAVAELVGDGQGGGHAVEGAVEGVGRLVVELVVGRDAVVEAGVVRTGGVRPAARAGGLALGHEGGRGRQIRRAGGPQWPHPAGGGGAAASSASAFLAGGWRWKV